MPNFDLKLPELKKYRGSSPRPGDFDAYWKKALAELDGVPFKVELRKADFVHAKVEAFHLFFQGTGGARIHAKYLRPMESAGRAPAIASFHGYSAQSGSFSSYLPWLTLGYSVFALDCRGQNGLSESTTPSTLGSFHGNLFRGIENPEHLLFRYIFLDAVQLIRIAAKEKQVDPKKIAVTGGSQGGGLALAAAALVPEVALCAAGCAFLSDYKRVWELSEGRANDEINPYFQTHDPFHKRADEIFGKLGYIDVQHLAPRIRARTLMWVGLMDKVCPPSTVFAIYNKLKCKKKILVAPNQGHAHPWQWEDLAFGFLGKLG